MIESGTGTGIVTEIEIGPATRTMDDQNLEIAGETETAIEDAAGLTPSKSAVTTIHLGALQTVIETEMARGHSLGHELKKKSEGVDQGSALMTEIVAGVEVAPGRAIRVKR